MSKFFRTVYLTAESNIKAHPKKPESLTKVTIAYLNIRWELAIRD